MNYIDHDHKHTVQRGGNILSGSSSYDDRITIDTPEYNKFDLSHSWRGTGKLGVINPCLNMAVIAGDNVQLKPSLFQRFQPLVSPIITPVESSLHTFYVPLRLLDAGFEQHLTGGTDGSYKRNLLNFKFVWQTSSLLTNDPDYPKRFLVNGKQLFGLGSLLDDFNYGYHVSSVTSAGGVKVTIPSEGIYNLFPLIAYHLIYNEYYRAEEIETDLWMPSYNSSTTTYTTAIRENHGHTLQQFIDFMHSDPRMQGFCYYMLQHLTNPLISDFNSGSVYNRDTNSILVYTALTNVLTFSNTNEESTTQWENLGYELTCLDAFVIYLLSSEVMPWERDRFTTCLPYLQRGATEVINKYVEAKGTVNNNTAVRVLSTLSPYSALRSSDGTVRYSIVSSLDEDGRLMSGAISMNDIRQLNAATRFLEKNARIGYRFTEWLSGMFGVEKKSPDHLDKPTYIGGLKGSASIDTIFSTSNDGAGELGEYAGAATQFASADSCHISVPEHGVIIGVYGTKPRSSYINCVDRNNIKYGDRTLFFTPDFAHLQEQPLFDGEIDGTWMTNNITNLINGKIEEDITSNEAFFGYEPRYNEYRSMNSTTHGELASTLSYFTTSRWGSDTHNPGTSEIENDYAFQHVSPTDECVNRIFNVSSSLADQFISEVSWNISKLSLMPSQATPSL